MKSLSVFAKDVLIKSVLLLFILQIEVSAQDFKAIVSDGGLVACNGCNLDFKNTSLVNYGSFIASGGSKIIFSGNKPAFLQGSNTVYADTVLIDKISAAKVVLENDVNISGNLIISSGTFDLSNKIAYLGPQSFIINESRENHITGSVQGMIKTSKPVEGPYYENTGNIGFVIKSNHLSGAVNIERSHAEVSQIKSIGRVYSIDNKNSNAGCQSIKLAYFDNELKSNDENLLSVWHSEDGITWNEIGCTERDIKNNYVELRSTVLKGMFTLAPSKFTNAINIYPNPVNTKAFISLVSKDVYAGKILIVDAKGQIVLSQMKNIFKGANNLSIDLSRLPAGVYTVLLQSNNLSCQSKLVKI